MQWHCSSMLSLVRSFMPRAAALGRPARRVMSIVASHKDSEENNAKTKFEFTTENLKLAKEIIARYPVNCEQSAIMPLLDLAQRQHNGWLPLAAMNAVAKLVDVAPIRVYEVASFYTMYNRQPVGKYHVQVCTTTPCMLRGAYEILETCKKNLHVDIGETTPDKLFTLAEVECLGACVNAPMLQIGDDFYEDLTVESTNKLLDDLRAGKKVKVGPQTNRNNCEGPQGRTTLKGEVRGPYATTV